MDPTRDYPLPVPIDLPVPDRAQLRRRAVQTVRVAGRNLGPLVLRKIAKREVSEHALARPLRLTFEELGATYVKFGQLLGSSPGVFGSGVSDEFRSCLDTGPPVPFWKVRMLVERDVGTSLEDAFSAFNREPLAAASIAVVHRAVLKDGREVAVKVLRPGVEGIVACDLDLMEPLFELLARQVGVGVAGPLLQLLSGFREQVAEEMDLRNEAKAMTHYRGLLEHVDLPHIVVPEPFEEFSGRHVLTMEFLDGVPIDDLAGIADFGIDPRPLVEEIVKGWFITCIRNGTFHGDVHAGNLMLMRDGRVGILDWGIVGRLDPGTHQFMRWAIQAALGDESAWEKIGAHLRKVYGDAVMEGLGFTEDEMNEMIRRQMEPIFTQPFGEVSLAVMFTTPQDQMADARGEQARRRSLRDIIKSWREMRRLRNLADDHGGTGSDFDRGTFLLGKQLLYFDRYGKMFLSDIALLEDEEFFRSLLEEEPIT